MVAALFNAGGVIKALVRLSDKGIIGLSHVAALWTDRES
jgi:hypothetical protein